MPLIFLSMDLQLIISFLVFSLIISFSTRTYGQQPYVGQAPTDCDNMHNSTSALGYTCNGQAKSCQGYLIFRSIPPYNTVSSISRLLASNGSQLSQINSVSETATFETNKEVIVPVKCSCSGQYYQSNSSYVTAVSDNYFVIANNTYQGLSTCQTLINQNKIPARNLIQGVRILVPLRCACPTKNQTNKGVKYLLSYIIASGQYVSLISERFGVESTATLEANELSEDSNIYPFTTLLVPLQNPPSNLQTIVPPPPPLPPPFSTPPPSPGKKKTGVYIIIGVVAGSTILLILSIILFCFCKHKNRIIKPDQNIISESFESYEKPQEKNTEEDTQEFLDSISAIAQSLKVYKFQELQSATDNFSPNCLIQGSVYRGIINGHLAAIKEMNGDVSKELNVLNQINHFNLIKLSGVCFSEGRWYLVYEYAVNGSLSDWIFYDINSTNVLSWTERVQIGLDVATGLNYLHSYANPSHVHKDINSSNILLDSDFRAKVANFGLARSTEGLENEFALTRHIVGTKGYMAPEYLEHGLVSSKLDVYAFGVVMLEMITGKEASLDYKAKDVLSPETLVTLLAEDNSKERLKDFIDPSLQEKYPLELALQIARLVEGCLRRDPAVRPNMGDIVQFLSKILATSMTWESINNTSESHNFVSSASETST